MRPDPTAAPPVRGGFPPGSPDGPPLPGYEPAAPPGTTWRTAPDGQRYLDYTDQPTDAPVPPVAQPMPAWAKAAALVMGVGSAGTSMVALTLSLAVESLQALAHALWAFAGSVAAVALVVAAVASCFRRSRAGRTVATATATATKRGVFGGKATATATAVAKAPRR